jgi:hypothetical protein
MYSVLRCLRLLAIASALFSPILLSPALISYLTDVQVSQLPEVVSDGHCALFTDIVAI